MRYLEIRTIRDEMTGELGFNLIKNGMPNNGSEFVAGHGLIIAHDIIEHQQGLKNIGTLEDELIALGGITYTRVVTGELQTPIFTGEKSLSFDIARMFEYYSEKCYRSGKKYYPKRLLEDYEYDSIMETIQIARKSLILNEDEEWYYDDDRKKYIEPYLSWCKHLMLHGVYKAEKRFGNNHVALHVFKMIEEEVNRHSKWIDYEGQEFILGYTHSKAVMYEKEIEYE